MSDQADCSAQECADNTHIEPGAAATMSLWRSAAGSARAVRTGTAAGRFTGSSSKATRPANCADVAPVWLQIQGSCMHSFVYSSYPLLNVYMCFNQAMHDYIADVASSLPGLPA